MDLNFKLAKYDDFNDFLKLRQEPKNIYWTGYSSPPVYDKLLEHFVKDIDSKTRDVCLLFDSNIIVGYLYLDYFDDDNIVELSYGISEYYAGNGLAKIIVSLGEQYIKKSHYKKIAWIAENNIASIKTAIAQNFEKTLDWQNRIFETESELVRFYKYIK